jgi:adrenodoxin-NADP+ reductase
MVEDLSGLASASDPAPAAVDRLLAERGARVVDFPDWQRLDRIEVERGRSLGRPRVKLGAVAEMLAALDAEA